MPEHKQVACVYLGPDSAYARCSCGRSIDAGSEYLASYLLHNHITAANWRAASTAATEALLKEIFNTPLETDEVTDNPKFEVADTDLVITDKEGNPL